MTDDFINVFAEWMEKKQELHFSRRVQAFKEWEIWWCAVGKNIGVEINGKNETYARPVLIFKKFSRFSFSGIPLTTQPHEGTWYAHFRFQGKDEYAALMQMRPFSVLRLYRKMGDIDDVDKKTIYEAAKALYFPD